MREREREREKEKEKEKLNFFRTPEENFCEKRKNEEQRRGAEKISKNLPWKTKEEEEEEEEKEKGEEEEEIREALLHYFGDQNIG